MKIQVDTKSLDMASEILKAMPREAEKIVNRAKGRALESARTEGLRTASSIYDTKQATLRASTKINKGQGALISRGSRLPLMDFKVSPKTPQRKVVRASVKKRGGTISYAFVAPMSRTGHIGVYTRVSKKRLPIRELKSVSAPQMLGEPTVIEKTTVKAEEVLEKRIIHEINRALG